VTKDKKPFEVISYTPDNLALAMSNGVLLPRDVKIRKKRHYNYFLDYFGNSNDGLSAKTIVIEEKYLSKSYLQDYSNFYSNCYVNYRRFCKRIHFFGEKFSQIQFGQCISNPREKDNKIWDSYLGYIVIRPLPAAIVGATILKTFEDHNSERFYNSIREYKINLLGKNLVLKSLVFQEQDDVVGACASSALWSAFHKVSTQDIFQTPLPSPSEITKSVKNKFNDYSGRVFPNHGLTIEQICEAIDSVGLVSELIINDSLKQIDRLKALVYAYNKMGLPVLLVIKLEDAAYHLLTIAGYRMGGIKKKKQGIEITLVSNQIQKFYAHDDQVGPFSRLEFALGARSKKFELKTAWRNFDKKDSRGYLNILATTEGIIIPVHDEIKITFDDVQKQVNLINQFFKVIILESLDWEIYLDFSNNYKNELFNNLDAPGRIRKKILPHSIPKYIWLARASYNNESVVEVIFDATNIADAHFCKFINIYDDDLRDILISIFDNPNLRAQEIIVEQLGLKYLEIFEQET
jgi:hypothetical protein